MTKNPAALLPVFKPEWAFDTPQGFRDEVFLVPFSFIIPGSGALASKLPWSFDDDVPQILRAIVFPEIGTHETPAGIFQAPGLVRIWDGHGNPLSDDVALAAGVWCQSGYGLVNAFGFPIEPQIEIPEGGIVQFDFQITTNALASFFEFDGFTDVIRFVAGIYIAAGSTWTIQTIDPGAPNVALSVALVGGIHVQVTLATDGGGVITSTFADVAAAITAAGAAGLIPAPAPFAAFPIMLAAVTTGDGTEVITAFGPQALGAYQPSSPMAIAGTFLTIKRFKEC